MVGKGGGGGRVCMCVCVWGGGGGGGGGSRRGGGGGGGEPVSVMHVCLGAGASFAAARPHNNGGPCGFAAHGAPTSKGARASLQTPLAGAQGDRPNLVLHAHKRWQRMCVCVFFLGDEPSQRERAARAHARVHDIERDAHTTIEREIEREREREKREREVTPRRERRTFSNPLVAPLKQLGHSAQMSGSASPLHSCIISTPSLSR